MFEIITNVVYNQNFFKHNQKKLNIFALSGLLVLLKIYVFILFAIQISPLIYIPDAFGRVIQLDIFP